ncbi:hypothetical protein HDR58_02670 [bacterium]|nr:hypothetical protein [bacterium]
MYAILVVLFGTANFAFAKSANIVAMKTVAVKFTLAMLVIAVFSIIIFVGLSIYNKFFVPPQIKDFDLNKDSLRSPRDVDEAVRMFIAQNRLK